MWSGIAAALVVLGLHHLAGEPAAARDRRESRRDRRRNRRQRRRRRRRGDNGPTPVPETSIVYSEPFTVAAGQFGTGTAQCPTGTTAVGGGLWNENPECFVFTSQQDDTDDRSWVAGLSCQTSKSQAIGNQTQAVCLAVAS